MAREVVKDAFWAAASDMPMTPLEALMRSGPFSDPDVSYLEFQPLARMVEELEGTLSSTQLELLHMVVYEKLSFREIARQTGTSKSSVHRAWHALKAELAVRLLAAFDTSDTEGISSDRFNRAAREQRG